VSALALILLTGVPVTLHETYEYVRVRYPESSYYSEWVAPDGIAATYWLRDHTSPDEVLATNGHCPAGQPDQVRCLHLTSWVSAFAQRRVVVSGWGYVSKSVWQASQVPTWIGGVPFYDQPKLAVNDAAFYEPTPAVLAELRDRYGASWMIVDRTVRYESPALRDLATLRFERGDYAVYQLR
jgi:hypothetical protein